ncbi:MAG TPA: hypothetical protein VFV37_11080 [Luteibaculaceae bacterium]|nr:hypothetical protein [Luteibaculaceae bacterium]
MAYTELEKKIIEQEQAKLKKFEISYYYLATGMEGIPDIFPKKIIEAPTKEMAVFIYYLMFFASPTMEKIKNIESYNGVDYARQDYKTFLMKEDLEKYYGISVTSL